MRSARRLIERLRVNAVSTRRVSPFIAWESISARTSHGDLDRGRVVTQYNRGSHGSSGRVRGLASALFTLSVDVHMAAKYDQIGSTYTSTRKADARIAALIGSVIPPDAEILNVGAGTGSYEPEGARVFAVEPSKAMIAQRPRGSAPVIRALAEALPFGDQSVDVILGILTIHHWTDIERGLAECRRVARRRLVFLTWDPTAAHFWLTEDYFPQLLAQARALFPSIDMLRCVLGAVHSIPVPIPSDCTDGFLGAYWKRPAAYCDAVVRRGISAFAMIDDVHEPLARLKSDIASGEWLRRNHSLSALSTLDLGYRIVVAEA